MNDIEVKGASEHNLKAVDVSVERGAITVVTGVSGSGKSSLAFDTILAESQRRFLHTLSHYSRQFLELQARPLVRSVTGLSPAVSLAQNETMPSKRATVGTLSDISELFGIMFARFGDQYCPKHNQPTSALSTEDIVAHISNQFDGKTVALCAPVVEAKKGTFKKQLLDLNAKGYSRFHIDGEKVESVPELNKDEKHTIKVLIDFIKIRPGNEARLARSVATSVAEGQGYIEVATANARGEIDVGTVQTFSVRGACGICGFSWPALDSRYFSANSLGACRDCNGRGYLDQDDEVEESSTEDESAEPGLESDSAVCVSCSGTGLWSDLKAVRINNLSVIDCSTLPISSLMSWLSDLESSKYWTNLAFRRVFEETHAALTRIHTVGLGYLALARRVRTLSGGESQRLKLAGILSGQLRGVLYVLDEPSQGLHPSEIDIVAGVLKQLRDRGNTILIVDHDEGLMGHADWIIDLGPGGGVRGGRVLAKFKPKEAAAFAAQSETAGFLANRKLRSKNKKDDPASGNKQIVADQKYIEIFKASAHNLNVSQVKFPLGKITAVAGVSGAGKSSLVLTTLYANLYKQIQHRVSRSKGQPPELEHCSRLTGFEILDQVHLVDRKPIAKSGTSIPASFLGILTLIRDLYAALPEGQVLGLTSRHFSLSVEAGRCPECKGRGEVSLKMRFLADTRTKCPLCRGKRFKTNVLAVKYLGLSINEVLDLTLDEALLHFKNHKKIVTRLQPAVELGLGYLKLGQPSASLSGGEAQRLKLVPMLAKQHGETSMVILDEPTTGLHFRDVERLLVVLQNLAERGTTIVLIEHNCDVFEAADWAVELGPGAAENGGLLSFAGRISEFKSAKTLSARSFFGA